LTIAPLRVRYAVRRAGQRLEDAAPAGDVAVPGAAIAFRSVLPDDQDVAGIRSDKPPHARPPRYAALQLVGIGLVIVAIVPGVLAMAAVLRRIRRPRVRRSARAVRHEERASLEAVRQANVDPSEGRRAHRPPARAALGGGWAGGEERWRAAVRGKGGARLRAGGPPLALKARAPTNRCVFFTRNLAGGSSPR